MPEQIHCEILSTIQAISIQPDRRLQTQIQSTGIQCRICLEQTTPLIAPCKCDGTMRFVHQKCLKKWASDKIRFQIQKQEEKAKAQLSPIHGIQCQLCKQTIVMKVKKMKKLQSWSQAKQKTQIYFLPFLPLVIANSLILISCFVGIIFIITFSLMIIFQNQGVDYKKYEEHPIFIQTILVLTLGFSILFMLKSLFELYHIFIKEQYDVVQVIHKQVKSYETQIQTTTMTLPNCKEFKEINYVDGMITQSSPKGDQAIYQNKFSLTRQKINLQRRIAKQIAKRKLLEITQSPKISNMPSLQSKEVSIK